MQKIVTKIGYYTIYEEKTKNGIKYVVDSGKRIYIERLKKYIVNPYRDTKEFKNIKDAKDYILLRLKNNSKEKFDRINKIPKSLYLILIKEESTDKTFVKVGITSKKFLMRRFSKKHGYKGYIIESILRRIDTPNAEILEETIKEKIKKKKLIKKYRPILKSFSGYSECFDILSLDEIVKIFDDQTKSL